MDIANYIASHFLYYVSVILGVLLLSKLTNSDPEKVFGLIRYIINGAIGGLLLFFIVITFYDYFK